MKTRGFKVGLRISGLQLFDVWVVADSRETAIFLVGQNHSCALPEAKLNFETLKPGEIEWTVLEQHEPDDKMIRPVTLLLKVGDKITLINQLQIQENGIENNVWQEFAIAGVGDMKFGLHKKLNRI